MDVEYIIRNQEGHYWGRGKRWVDGRETAKVALFTHRDEVANTLFEISSKDVDLRCEILDIARIEGKLPRLEVSQIPLPYEDDASGSTAELETVESGPT